MSAYVTWERCYWCNMFIALCIGFPFLVAQLLLLAVEHFEFAMHTVRLCRIVVFCVLCIACVGRFVVGLLHCYCVNPHSPWSNRDHWTVMFRCQ